MTNAQTFKIALLAALIGMGGVAASAKTPDQAKMFEKLDTNSDGAVTQEELKALAAQRFAKTDANGDGFLTADEMINARSGKRAQKMLERFDTDGDGQLSAAEIDAMGETRAGKRAEKMMKRLDTNEDGKIALEEMTVRRDPAKMFERLDADGNGSLSAEEFAKARMHRGQGKDGKKRHED